MKLTELIALLDQKLEIWRFHDSAPNGLQVEGCDGVQKVLTSVTASREAIEEAVKVKADALLVHHGLFWKNDPNTIVGLKKQRIQMLLKHDMSLIAYHLPLDAHVELGNNAMLAKLFNWQVAGQTGDQNLIWYGSLSEPLKTKDFVATINQRLNRTAQYFGDDTRIIRKLAWCSGGAQSYFADALSLDIDAFITGEVSEPNYHMARESGVAFIAAGHHATETYGIKALGDWLAAETSIEVQHSQQYNPV